MASTDSGICLSKTGTGGAPTLSQSVNMANNQIVGQSYDSDGNQFGDTARRGDGDTTMRRIGWPVVRAAECNTRTIRGTSGSGESTLSGWESGATGVRLRSGRPEIGTYTLTLGQYGGDEYTGDDQQHGAIGDVLWDKRIGTFDRLGRAKYNNRISKRSRSIHMGRIEGRDSRTMR